MARIKSGVARNASKNTISKVGLFPLSAQVFIFLWHQYFARLGILSNILCWFFLSCLYGPIHFASCFFLPLLFAMFRNEPRQTLSCSVMLRFCSDHPNINDGRTLTLHARHKYAKDDAVLSRSLLFLLTFCIKFTFGAYIRRLNQFTPTPTANFVPKL